MVVFCCLTRFMQYGDADVSVFVDIWMPDVCDELELRRSEGIFFGENQVTLEEAALVQSVRRTNN